MGGDGADALKLACAVYDALVVRTVPVSSPATAEAVKLTENIFRAVNIALVNELKIIYDKMGIDVWEVIDAAKTKPFGFMPFYPGPGLGGHCIPIDPFYLTWKAREFDVTTRFIELAGQINTAMPHYVIDRLAEALDRRQGRGLREAKILVVGIAYKKNVDDMRESPSLRLIELLEERAPEVDYHDPHVPIIPTTREHAQSQRPKISRADRRKTRRLRRGSHRDGSRCRRLPGSRGRLAPGRRYAQCLREGRSRQRQDREGLNSISLHPAFSELMRMTSFALIGAAGYIAPGI